MQNPIEIVEVVVVWTKDLEKKREERQQHKKSNPLSLGIYTICVSSCNMTSLISS